MVRRRTAGLLILKDGEIALERYGTGSGPERRWQSNSTAKSITSRLVGAASTMARSAAWTIAATFYLPRLRGSAYEGVTVRNVMRMCSGVAWSEETTGAPASGACAGPWRAGGETCGVLEAAVRTDRPPCCSS